MLLMFCYVKTYYAQYKGKQLVSSRELGSGLKQHPRQVISFNLSLWDCFLPAIQFWLIMKEKILSHLLRWSLIWSSKLLCKEKKTLITKKIRSPINAADAQLCLFFLL